MIYPFLAKTGRLKPKSLPDKPESAVFLWNCSANLSSGAAAYFALPKVSGFSKLSAVKALFGRGETCNTCFQVFRRPVCVYGLAGSSEKAFCFGAAVHSPITSVLYHVCALRSATCCSASVYELFRPILLKRAASLPCKHAILPFLLFPFSDDLWMSRSS